MLQPSASNLPNINQQSRYEEETDKLQELINNLKAEYENLQDLKMTLDGA